jgi:hypothetical protein
LAVQTTLQGYIASFLLAPWTEKTPGTAELS